MSRHSAAIGLLCICLSSATAQQGTGRSTLGAVESFESSSLDLNRSASTMTAIGLSISGANWSLQADKAVASSEALDFESGHWRFEGNIRLRFDTASLQAERADFEFRSKRIVLAELSGEPVRFEDFVAEQSEPVTGFADTLRYDDRERSFELLGDVSLTVGPYRTTGCDLVYYLGQEEFRTGSSQCDDPFVTTIVTQESADAPVE